MLNQQVVSRDWERNGGSLGQCTRWCFKGKSNGCHGVQRAKNVFILYNTENDSFGSGEKSRFVTQLEMMKSNINQQIITPEVVAAQLESKEINKDESVLVRLK